MADKRENNLSDLNYGTLNLRPYNISGNEIDAFYDADDDLVFVLDKTLNSNKNNVLLVINPDGDKKWDEILTSGYGVDLESVRPKQDNKYQKLDIEYSGLPVYGNLINAYDAGDDIDELLVQLNVLRDSAVRHSAMMRLNAANETIAATKATIKKTKESIVRLNVRLKTLRSNLSDMKKEIGREPTKKSASKILRAESQIDATNEKIKRAEKRLESAQRRLENATVDAKLAGDLLNLPGAEIKATEKNKPIAVVPKYEIQTVPAETESRDETMINDIDEKKFDNDKDSNLVTEDSNQEFEQSEIKPLFDQDPDIIDENNAFKPISFDAPDLPALDNQSRPHDEAEQKIAKDTDNLPVLETLTPVMEEKPVAKEEISEDEKWEPINISGVQSEMSDEVVVPDEKPVVEFESTLSETVPEEEIVRPVAPAPVDNGDSLPRPSVAPVASSAPIAPIAPAAPIAPVVSNYEDKKSGSKPTFLYYTLLLVLICASVFALWLYQKNMGNVKPWFSVATSEPEVIVSEPENVQPVEAVVAEPISDADVFVDTASIEPVVEPVVTEPIETEPEQTEPMIINNVSARVSAFANAPVENDAESESTNDDVVYAPVVNKPAYGAGSRYDEMFVYEEDQIPYESDEIEESDETYVEPGFEDDGIIYEPQFIEENAGVQDVNYDNQNMMYDDTVFYDDYIYDPEEAAYQAGDDGYDEY